MKYTITESALTQAGLIMASDGAIREALRRQLAQSAAEIMDEHLPDIDPSARYTQAYEEAETWIVNTLADQMRRALRAYDYCGITLTQEFPDVPRDRGRE